MRKGHKNFEELAKRIVDTSWTNAVEGKCQDDREFAKAQLIRQVAGFVDAVKEAGLGNYLDDAAAQRRKLLGTNEFRVKAAAAASVMDALFAEFAGVPNITSLVRVQTPLMEMPHLAVTQAGTSDRAYFHAVGEQQRAGSRAPCIGPFDSVRYRPHHASEVATLEDFRALFELESTNKHFERTLHDAQRINRLLHEFEIPNDDGSPPNYAAINTWKDALGEIHDICESAGATTAMLMCELHATSKSRASACSKKSERLTSAVWHQIREFVAEFSTRHKPTTSNGSPKKTKSCNQSKRPLLSEQVMTFLIAYIREHGKLPDTQLQLADAFNEEMDTSITQGSMSRALNAMWPATAEDDDRSGWVRLQDSYASSPGNAIQQKKRPSRRPTNVK